MWVNSIGARSSVCFRSRADVSSLPRTLTPVMADGRHSLVDGQPQDPCIDLKLVADVYGSAHEHIPRHGDNSFDVIDFDRPCYEARLIRGLTQARPRATAGPFAAMTQRATAITVRMVLV
jgi:hypothetical protein